VTLKRLRVELSKPRVSQIEEPMAQGWNVKVLDPRKKVEILF